jgi:hypothetical protein
MMSTPIRSLASGTSARQHPAAPGARTAAGAMIAVACLLAAGCGSKPAPSVSRPAAPASPPLTTSSATASGASWTVVEMGGSAAQENNFWQVFVRPTAAAGWRQVTPHGVADNGGLVVASPGSGSLVTAFRPSQLLTYTPLAASTDNGANWSSAGPLNASLASAADALAAGPDGQLIALTNGGAKAELGQRLGTTWTRLATVSSLNATPAGRACKVTALTAAAFNGSTPVLAAGCGRAGVAGIFADTGGTWHAAGPSLSGETVDVLALAASGNGLVALLRASAGSSASIVGAWYSAGRWALSSPLRIGAGKLGSTALGPGGSMGVTWNADRGATLAGPGKAWQTLPALPKRAATLALGSPVEVIAANGQTFRDYRLAAGGWSLAQTVHIQIPYGSSG